MEKLQRPNLDNRRDNNVLMHVLRNFITMLSVSHRLLFDGVSVDTARKVLKRLTRQEYLNEFDAWENKKLYRLGPKAVATWGYPRTRADALGPQALPYEIGTLAYTCLDETIRKRMMRHELLQLFPWFPENLMRWAYFMDGDQLGTIRVEPRAAGNPRKLIEKLAEQVYRYGKHPNLKTLIEEQRFFVVLVLVSEEQEFAIQDVAEDQAFPVRLETASYHELIRFM